MRRYLQFIIPIIIVAFIYSCDTKSCDNVLCSGNNQTCVNGQCVCQQGYEGDFCDILSAQKFIGNYYVSENCSTTLNGPVNTSYSCYITSGSAIDRIVINSFAQQYTVDAYINGNYISIPNQTVFGSTTIQGEGEFYPDLYRMTIQYEITQGSNFSSCTGIFTKQ